MAARRRRIDALIKPYRITDGRGFKLKQIDSLLKLKEKKISSAVGHRGGVKVGQLT